LPLLLLIALLAGCGSLPRPFEGNPGANARRLAEPPPPRLGVAVPDKAFLPPDAATRLADAIAAGLLAAEVPAATAPSGQPGWRLATTAEVRGETIVPMYAILDPKGEQAGITEGLPVVAAEWRAAEPPTLQRVAGEAAPRISSLLTRIEADRRKSDPNSLVNRAPRLAFAGVTGAPGDGNVALTQSMKSELVKAGQELFNEATGADFHLTGTVTVVPAGSGKDRVEIVWTVSDAAGKEAGRVVQLNEVRTGLLSRYWGDVALVVAQEAAGGVRDVIANRIAR
jgi:hypothetical protein